MSKTLTALSGAASGGLVTINPANYELNIIPASAGLQAGEFNAACSSRDSTGNLYFGGINGVTYFNPSTFSLFRFSPRPLIESLKVFNVPVPLGANIVYTRSIDLENWQNFISLEFAVTNFINNQECNFKYRMVGVDTNWVMAGNRNFVSYTNLRPGNYSFELASSNSNGVWSRDNTMMMIHINPAWWQETVVKLLAVLLLAALNTLLVRKRITSIKYHAAVRQKIAATEMAALKAQMNPHFIFHCLNSIDAFIQSNDKYNATLYLINSLN